MDPNSSTASLCKILQSFSLLDTYQCLSTALLQGKSYSEQDWRVFFQNFFAQRATWHAECGEKCPSFHLQIETVSLALLQGLSESLAAGELAKGCLNQLTLKGNWQCLQDSALQDQSNKKTIIDLFETLLTRLSEAGVTQLCLDAQPVNITSLASSPGDLSLTGFEEFGKCLLKLIQDKSITVEVVLPPLCRTTEAQKALDFPVWDNKACANRIDVARIEETTHQLPKLIRTTRIRQAETELSLSLDNQVEQQVEQVQAVGMARTEASIATDTMPHSAWNWETFSLAFSRRKLELEQPDYLVYLTKTQWDHWVNTSQFLGDYSQNEMTFISQSACEQLVRFHRQFQFGIDLTRHLPAGFFVREVDTPEFSQYILDYDSEKALYAKADPMAIQYYRSTQRALSPKTFSAWRGQLQEKPSAEQSAAEQLALAVCQQLDSSPYDRKIFSKWLAVLPHLLGWHTASIQSLRQLIQQADKLDLGCLIFVLDHLSVLQALPEVAMLTAKAHPAGSILTEQFGEERVPQVLELARLVKANTVDHQKTLLYRLIAAQHPNFLPELAAWVKRLSVDAQALAAWVPIYEIYGCDGLKTLFSIWEGLQAVPAINSPEKKSTDDNSLLTILYRSVFSQMPSLLPILAADYQQALATIKGFYGEPIKAAWWQSLLVSHAAAVGPDNLPALVGTFLAFCQRIEQWSLCFGTPPQFKGPIKSLPVTLSRMETILSACHPKHRPAQWQCITALDWSAQGVILNHYQSAKAFQFITPEMQVQLGNVLQQDTTLQDMRDLEGEAFLKAYYCYISRQSWTLSLSFYQKAMRDTQQAKFPPKLEKGLLLLLVASTVGAQQQKFLYTRLEKDLLEKWQAVCQAIGKSYHNSLFKPLAGPIISKICCDYFLQGSSIPPVNTLCDILQDVVSWNWRDYVEFGKNSEKFLSLFKSLDSETIISAWKFVHTREGSSAQAYQDCLELLLSLNKATEQVHAPLFFSAVARLLGIFQINAKDVKEIQAFLKTIKPDKHTQAALLLVLDELKYLEVDSENTLTSQDLLRFLQTVNMLENPSPKKWSEIRNLMRARFSAHYPQGFFETFSGKQLPADMEKQLRDHFEEQTLQEAIKRCIAAFETLDQREWDVFFQQIAVIVARSSQSSEYTSFFEALSTALAHNLAPTLEQFNELLAKIIQQGDTHAFEYFISQATAIQAKQGGQGEALLEKSIIFHTLFLQQKSVRYSVLSREERLKLTSHFVLALSKDETTLNAEQLEDLLKKLDKLINDYPTARELLIASLLQYTAIYVGQLTQAQLTQSITRFVLGLTALDDSDRLLALLSRFQADVKSLFQLLEIIYPQVEAVLVDNLGGEQALSEKEDPLPNKNANQASQAISASLLELLAPYGPFAKQAVALIYTSLLEMPITSRIITGLSWHVMRPSLSTHRLYPAKPLSGMEYRDEDLCSNSLSDSGFSDTDSCSSDQTIGSALAVSAAFPESYDASDVTNQEEMFEDAVDTMLLSPAWEAPLLAIAIYAEDLTVGSFQALYQACRAGRLTLEQISNYYTVPPYPSMTQLLDWQVLPTGEATAAYQAFLRSPYPRDPKNGFNLQFAYHQIQGFKGCKLMVESLKSLSQGEQWAKHQSLSSLQDQYHTMQCLAQPQRNIVKDIPTLIAVTAEILYRTTGQALNTTQYLAVLALLTQTASVQLKMATGEGKSRVILVTSACKWIQGKTLYCITSSIDLARRDFLAAQPFFSTLEIPTSLISATSQQNNANTSGIHFSTAADLSLFKNRQQLAQLNSVNPAAYPDKPILFIDEIDHILCDTETRFNCSQSLPAMRALSGIYETAVLFIDTTEIGQALMRDAEADWHAGYQAFIQFACNRCSRQGEDYQRLKVLPIEEVIRLLDAAILASNLIYQKDYGVEMDAVCTDVGQSSPRLASQVYVIQGNQKASGSRFANGVHECLQAQLEVWRRQLQAGVDLSAAIPLVLQQALLACVHPFPKQVESGIVYSSSVQDLLDSAETIIGVTGTPEKKESALLYSIPYITVPHHTASQRVDLPPHIVSGLAQQAAAIVTYVIQARTRRQAVLVVARDDQAVDILITAVKTANQDNPNPIPDSCFQQIKAGLSDEAFDQALQRASESGRVTVGTDRLGRGVNIIQDLLVLPTYLMDTRRYKQVLGRAGRQGGVGETRLIIDRTQYPTLSDAFFLAPEKWLKEYRSQLDQALQTQRLQHKIPQARYYTYLQTKAVEALRANASASSEHIMHSLIHDNKKLREQVTAFAEHLASQPNLAARKAALIQFFNQQGINHEKEPNVYAECLRSLDVAEQLAGEACEKARKFKKIPVFHAYDQAHAGRAKVYDQLFVETRALLAGLWESYSGYAKGLLSQIIDFLQSVVSWLQNKLHSLFPQRVPCTAPVYSDLVEKTGLSSDELLLTTPVPAQKITQPVEISPIQNDRNTRLFFANTREYWKGNGILFADTRAVLAGKRPFFANTQAWLNKGFFGQSVADINEEAAATREARLSRRAA
jgi:SecA DEAD-like domain